jgi:hypothetical protein
VHLFFGLSRHVLQRSTGRPIALHEVKLVVPGHLLGVVRGS